MKVDWQAEKKALHAWMRNWASTLLIGSVFAWCFLVVIAGVALMFVGDISNPGHETALIIAVWVSAVIGGAKANKYLSAERASKLNKPTSSF